MIRKIIFSALLCLSWTMADAADVCLNDTIVEESRVPSYTLPKILVDKSGKAVTSKEQWEAGRRAEILDAFRENVYGYAPEAKIATSYKLVETNSQAVGGKAVRKQIEITWKGNGQERKAMLLVLLPKKVSKAPVFTILNFMGNSYACAGDGVIPSKYTEEARYFGLTPYPLDMIISKGYGIATMQYFEVYFDDSLHFDRSIYPLMGIKDKSQLKANSGNAISAWAWGYSQVLDYLLTDNGVDPSRIISLGLSRMGKTALWAAANDKRFAMAISNESGCGGAAISRRCFGERVEQINTSFPYWFCANFHKYNSREDALPLDQHELLSLIAPRPLYVASAEEDTWADPHGEFISAREVENVYALYGYKGLGTDIMPDVNTPVGDRVGYHIRTGSHDLLPYDWKMYIRFADRWFYGK